ncbi:unnamed protein product [Trichogramma brassicae]|uniref:Uncharacterized protein n=1 Tax=Trichogramma brassicae TaxID=86971 RepID=A0A6H5J6K7_9HYME|nr:unnamed protein product [Trichogramma brassicae]
MSGFINLVGNFLEFGQDPNSLSQESKANEVDPPLHLALKYGHEEMAELLLRSGADPNLTNDEGLTPLHIICIGNDDHYDNGEMAEMFFNIIDEIQQTVQVDAQDKSGNTPLHLALAKEYSEGDACDHEKVLQDYLLSKYRLRSTRVEMMSSLTNSNREVDKPGTDRDIPQL